MLEKGQAFYFAVESAPLQFFYGVSQLSSRSYIYRYLNLTPGYNMSLFFFLSNHNHLT